MVIFSMSPAVRISTVGVPNPGKLERISLGQWSLEMRKPDQCNRFYDVFKLDPEHISRYLTLICQRLVTLQDEFGKPVGRLDKFLNERYLPAAPQAEIEECKQQ